VHEQLFIGEYWSHVQHMDEIDSKLTVWYEWIYVLEIYHMDENESHEWKSQYWWSW
jgi:hypothetical protein